MPQQRKEINIFSKVLTDKYTDNIIRGFNGNHNEAKDRLFKVKIQLENDEGLSDYWGMWIYNSLYGVYSRINPSVKESVSTVNSTKNISP